MKGLMHENVISTHQKVMKLFYIFIVTFWKYFILSTYQFA